MAGAADEASLAAAFWFDSFDTDWIKPEVIELMTVAYKAGYHTGVMSGIDKAVEEVARVVSDD